MTGHIATDSTPEDSDSGIPVEPTPATSPRRRSAIESPFARRHVQVTLAVLAAVALLWLMVTWWLVPSPADDPAEAWRGGSLAGEPLDGIVIDLNGAPARELSLLPGVGPVLAKRIVENRDRLGPFTSVQELQRVHGIGPKKLDQIQSHCIADAPRLARRAGQ